MTEWSLLYTCPSPASFPLIWHLMSNKVESVAGRGREEGLGSMVVYLAMKMQCDTTMLSYGIPEPSTCARNATIIVEIQLETHPQLPTVTFSIFHSSLYCDITLDMLQRRPGLSFIQQYPDRLWPHYSDPRLVQWNLRGFGCRGHNMDPNIWPYYTIYAYVYGFLPKFW